MSCSSRMPRVAAPRRVGSSPRSLSSCSTNADDDSDSAAPITMASSKLRIDTSACGAFATSSRKPVTRLSPPLNAPPNTGRPTPVNMAVHRTICSVPRPNAYFARACRQMKQAHVHELPCTLRHGDW
eukprot:362156-Chlamydomonas_euryale.AAC.7